MPAARPLPDFIDTEELGGLLTAIGTNSALPNGLPKNYKDLIARAKALIENGADRKSLKQALRWDSVRKKLPPDDLAEVQAAIDLTFDQRDPSVRKDILNTDEKIMKMRSRRESKIHDLIAKGQTRAQIHSNMKIKDWDKSEQVWFESIINEAQAHSSNLTGLEKEATAERPSKLPALGEIGFDMPWSNCISE